MPIVTTSSRKRPSRHSSLVTRHSSLAIAAVVIVAAVAVYLAARAVRPRQAPPKVPDTTEKPASGSPAAAAPSAATGGAASGRAEPERGETPHLPVAVPSTLQPFNSSTSALASAEAEAPEPPPLPELPPTALKMAAEQLLALVISANDDVELPPPPMGDERTLRRDLMIALTNDIVIYDDEDPKSQQLKEDIAEAKLHLKQVIDEGGSITQAIEDYRAWKRENIQMRREVRSEYVRLRREATREEAEEYLREANKALEAEGVQPIEIGPPRRKKSVKNGDPRPPKPEPAQEQ